MHLNIFVSPKCFLYCKGCYSFSRTEDIWDVLCSKTIIKFLAFAYTKGLRRVTLCGGDPLTRPDILELLKSIKKIGYNISLDTVGTSIIKEITKNGRVLVKQTNAECLAKLVDKIGIPIDGASNNVIKKFRITRSNILEDQIKICEELSKYNANICINTVVHKQNLQDAENMGQLINKMPYINNWQLFQYAPLGKYGWINKDLFEITEEEFDSFKEKLVKNYNHKNKIQFKGLKDRKCAYMLIDNRGNAWIPNFEHNRNGIEKRKFIGNIGNNVDWEEICQYLLGYKGKVYETRRYKSSL